MLMRDDSMTPSGMVSGHRYSLLVSGYQLIPIQMTERQHSFFRWFLPVPRLSFPGFLRITESE
jgi:hypothetical protein